MCLCGNYQVTREANGTAVATFNTAGSAPCTGTPTLGGQVSTELGVTLAVELTKGTQVAMVRSAMGEYCSLNQQGVLAMFPATADPANTTADENALSQCELFCMKNDKCNACSVDDRRSKKEKAIVWVAIQECGPIDPWAGTIPGDVSIKGTQGVAKITMSGPTGLLCHASFASWKLLSTSFFRFPSR